MPASETRSEGNAHEALSLRQRLMTACAFATEEELANTVALFDHGDEAVDVRPPETGMVMLRGRIGGDGSAFNVGEATVTRAVVRLATGDVGFSYMLGSSATRARLAAVVDALGQRDEHVARLETHFLAPVARRREAERRARQDETDATRVNFFTLARGED
jgi:alpha-D-ribose 1-methylphosphonate 5-triphosphate synthase subunit PhnG